MENTPAWHSYKMEKSALSYDTRLTLEAFNERYELCGPFDDNWQELCLAAAIRTLADRVVPADPCGDDCCIEVSERVRADLLSIANELESSG